MNLRLNTSFWASPAYINMVCVPVTTWQHVLDMWCWLSRLTVISHLCSQTQALTYTNTHSQHRLLKSRCIYVHLQRHVNTLKCPADEGAIFPLHLNGNHVLVWGWDRLGKVSPSTHYMGWPMLSWGGWECSAVLCSSGPKCSHKTRMVGS